MTVASGNQWCTSDPRSAPSRRTPLYLNVFRTLLYACLLGAILVDGCVIRAAAVCGLVLALFGDWSGGVRQVLRLFGLTAVVWLAPDVGPVVGGWLTARASVSPALAEYAGMGIFVVAALVVAGLIGGGVSRLLRKRRHLNALNHIAGSMVGVGEGVLLVAIFSWVLAVFGSSIEAARDRAAAEVPPGETAALDRLCAMDSAIRGDRAGRWLMRNNPLEDLPALQTARALAEEITSPQPVGAEGNGSDAEELIALPEVRGYLDAIQSDPAMRTALEQGDMATLMASSHVRAMLEDRDLHRAIQEHRDRTRREAPGNR